MANYALNRNQRLYMAMETTFGTGAAVTGSNCCLIKRAQFLPKVDVLQSESKTGTRTVPQGVGGRRHATWSIEIELRANGAAGVKPDMDPLLQAAFGQAGVVVSSTSVTYSLSDSIPSFTAYSYRTPSAVAQQVAIGCVLQRATFRLGENIASATLSGVALFVPDTFTYASLDSTGKGGLGGSIAAEPGSPTTNGPIIAGFTGQATVDAIVMATIRTGEIDINLNNDIPLDVFGSYYGGTPEGDARDIGVSFSTYDDDSSGATNIRTKAVTKAPIDTIWQIGTVAGSIFTFTAKGVQLETPELIEGQRKFQANVPRSRAHGSSLTSKDELALVIT